MTQTFTTELIYHKFIRKCYNFSLEEWEGILKANKTLVQVRNLDNETIDGVFAKFNLWGIHIYYYFKYPKFRHYYRYFISILGDKKT
ncbi:MAG: hypothetical protein ACFE95_02065 [Candidatus Hodarchaeota archaeon]